VAKGFGAAGIEIRRDADVEAGLAEARRIAASGKPVLVNVWLDKTAFREGSLSM
jgi:acetolactate synthase-1/2/3 large subunit